jgi:hypothetical protein
LEQCSEIEELESWFLAVLFVGRVPNVSFSDRICDTPREKEKLGYCRYSLSFPIEVVQCSWLLVSQRRNSCDFLCTVVAFDLDRRWPSLELSLVRSLR